MEGSPYITDLPVTKDSRGRKIQPGDIVSIIMSPKLTGKIVSITGDPYQAVASVLIQLDPKFMKMQFSNQDIFLEKVGPERDLHT